MMVGLGGMALWIFDGGRVLKCMLGMEVPFGTMVMSSAGLAKFMQVLTIKITWWFDDGDDKYIRYMMCSLSIWLRPRFAGISGYEICSRILVDRGILLFLGHQAST
jgi:hypothetical protein